MSKTFPFNFSLLSISPFQFSFLSLLLLLSLNIFQAFSYIHQIFTSKCQTISTNYFYFTKETQLTHNKYCAAFFIVLLCSILRLRVTYKRHTYKTKFFLYVFLFIVSTFVAIIVWCWHQQRATL